MFSKVRLRPNNGEYVSEIIERSMLTLKKSRVKTMPPSAMLTKGEQSRSKLMAGMIYGRSRSPPMGSTLSVVAGKRRSDVGGYKMGRRRGRQWTLEVGL